MHGIVSVRDPARVMKIHALWNRGLEYGIAALDGFHCLDDVWHPAGEDNEVYYRGLAMRIRLAARVGCDRRRQPRRRELTI